MLAFAISFKRPQFRLKTLLMLVTLVSIPLAIRAHRERQYRSQLALLRMLGEHAQADELERGDVLETIAIRGTIKDELVSAIEQVPTLVAFSFFQHANPSELQFQAMIGARRVEVIHFQYCEIGDDVVRHLTGKRSMARLTLEHTKIRGDSLCCLDSMPELELLDLKASRISDESLAHVAGLSKLLFLGLSETGISDKGLRNLRGLSSLDTLALRHCAITDTGLRDLARFDKLTSLDLSKTEISDNAIQQLWRLKTLKTLDLEDCAITDAALEDLVQLFAEMEGLRNLSLTGTLMSAKAIAELEARAKGRISWHEVPDYIREIKKKYGY